ncbi:MAG: hypothetical protein QW260_05610 [Thermoproteota archaeon]
MEEKEAMKAKRMAWYGLALVVVSILLAVIVLVGGTRTGVAAVGGVLGFIIALLGVTITYLANRKYKRLVGK